MLRLGAVHSSLNISLRLGGDFADVIGVSGGERNNPPDAGDDDRNNDELDDDDGRLSRWL